MSGTYSSILISKENREFLEREKKKTGFSFTTIINLLVAEKAKKLKK